MYSLTSEYVSPFNSNSGLSVRAGLGATSNGNKGTITRIEVIGINILYIEQITNALGFR